MLKLSLFPKTTYACVSVSSQAYMNYVFFLCASILIEGYFYYPKKKKIISSLSFTHEIKLFLVTAVPNFPVLNAIANCCFKDKKNDNLTQNDITCHRKEFNHCESINKLINFYWWVFNTTALLYYLERHILLCNQW